MAPKRSQYEPEGLPKGPNMSQKGAKMTPKSPKGRSKVTPKATKILQKNTTSKKVEKGRSGPLSFGDIFDVFLNKNVSKNRSEKLCRKTRQKNVKLSKKQGTIQPQKIEILKFLMQRRFLQNNVFILEKQCFLKIPCLESVHTFEKHPREK